MTALRRLSDGFQNIVANLGTSRDKSRGNGYVATMLDHDALLSAYRGSSVARLVVDAPAVDSVREWRAWQAKDVQISDIEAEEKRLGVQRLVMSARKRARLFGGSAIYIGTGDSDPSQPLRPDSVRKGGLQYLTLLDRSEVTPGMIQRDPTQPGYNEPEDYTLTAATGSLVRIHPSRLVRFYGDELPRNDMTSDGWADPVLQTALEKVGHLDATVANVASLVFEAKVDVFRIPDFTQNLREGGQEFETEVLRKLALMAQAKGINGMLVTDKEEEYVQKSASFATLPDIIDRMMQMVAAASEIPMTRLFGMSPGGLNATGESDQQNYHQRIKREQTLEIEPAMAVLDECLIRSALGSRPPEVHFTWNPLSHMSQKERAEVAEKVTTALERVAKMDVGIPEEALADSVVNALTEIGIAPGLEAKYAEYGGFDAGADEGDE